MYMYIYIYICIYMNVYVLILHVQFFEYIGADFDHLVFACGSGGTAAGFAIGKIMYSFFI
jgi:1-aminocyclopropane-1-carboxylate deaminase/D-cysteine desulfhydrase-like pyridoxal-dependent ACC family enzyme